MFDHRIAEPVSPKAAAKEASAFDFEGMNAHLAKPIDIPKLFETLSSFFS